MVARKASSVYGTDMPRISSGNDGEQLASWGELNARMTKRVLREPPQPLVEGNYALRVLETRGRISGQARRVPIGLVQREQQWWVVSPDWSRDWVRNLRADPRCAVLTSDERVPRWAVPAQSQEVAMVVPTYLSAVNAPWARQAFPVAPDASQAKLIEQAPKMAVFHLDSSDSGNVTTTELGDGS